MRDDYIDADLGPRFLANLVDSILILIVMLVPSILMFVATESGPGSWPDKDDSSVDAVINVFALGASVAYFAVFDAGRWRATPGKMIFRLQVRHIDGRPLSYAGALWRAVAKTLLLNLCGLTAFSVFLGDHRGWWNGLTNARVVKAGPDKKPSAIDPEVFE